MNKKKQNLSEEEFVLLLTKKRAIKTLLFIFGFILLALGMAVRNYIPCIFASCLLYQAVKARQQIIMLESEYPELKSVEEKSLISRRVRIFAATLNFIAGGLILYAALKTGSVVGFMLCGLLFWLGIRSLFTNSENTSTGLSSKIRRMKKRIGPISILCFAVLFIISSFIMKSKMGFVVGIMLAYFGIKENIKKRES